MDATIFYLLLIVVFFYFITRPPKFPRCGKRMEEKYNMDNGVSYVECPHCGHIEVTGRDEYI